VPDNRRDTFDQLRRFVTNDLRAVLALERGGNYTTALLIAVGCEALSRLMDRPTDFYLTEILNRRGLPRDLAEDVAGALRNGIAHSYDTRYVQAGPLRVELIIGWGARPHLTMRREPPGLYLNVRTMADDLEAVFQELHDTLPAEGTLPRDWVARSAYPADGRHDRLWLEWLNTATEDAAPK
jgi:hypothetical protein